MFSSLQGLHPQWQDIIHESLGCMSSEYLETLMGDETWLPGPDKIFNAFGQDPSRIKTLLLGESPYPRMGSANGYAFWDGCVGSVWSETGLSKSVNRATSLRNIMKMLLHARGDLNHDLSQAAIAKLDKSSLVKSLDELFENMLNQGFLLLNASLVLTQNPVSYDAKHWVPFMTCLLEQLHRRVPSIKLLLFGKIAKRVENIDLFDCLIAEHPYNLSFITNPVVTNFFKPLDLLKNDCR